MGELKGDSSITEGNSVNYDTEVESIESSPSGLRGDSSPQPDGSMKAVQYKEQWKEIPPNLRLRTNSQAERL